MATEYVPGAIFIKTFAKDMILAGMDPKEAVERARSAWAKNIAAEKAAEEAMNNDSL